MGGYMNGLAVVRSLGSAGIASTVITTRPYDLAHRSRLCAERVDLRSFHASPEALIELLLARAHHWHGSAVYPTDDHALTVLVQHREALERHYRLPLPAEDASSSLLDKARLEQAAGAAGVPTPRSYGEARADLAGDGVEFPVVVKPKLSHLFRERFDRKLFLARDPEELRRAIELLVREGLEGMVHDFVPGPDTRFFNYAVYIDSRGDPAGGIVMHKLRKNPPTFGVCRVAETCTLEALGEPTVELLRRVGFRGMANAEYKLDPRDGSFRLMEVNCRPFLMQGLARRAGIDLPMLAWQEHVLGERPRARANGWSGVWIDSHSDLLRALLSRRLEQVGVREYVAPYRRPRTFAVWSWSDPAPYAAQWSWTLAEGRRAAVDPRSRRALARAIAG